jgi:hypothetical protein
VKALHGQNVEIFLKPGDTLSNLDSTKIMYKDFCQIPTVMALFEIVYHLRGLLIVCNTTYI